MWDIPKIWQDGECWIIGGGSSILKQFNIPDEVSDSVLSKKAPLSVYSPFMSSLHDKHVIGINVAYQLGNWIDFVFFGDIQFFLKYEKQLMKTSIIRVTCHASPVQKYHKYIKYTPKDTNKIKGISTMLGHVSWNGNSGAAAINLAVHLGAAKIYLLGFDMKLDEKNNQHFHNLYDTVHRQMNERKKLPFHRHLVGFPQIAKDAEKLGVKIMNVNPDSAIDCFEKCELNSIL